uniref:Protein kinase domain-containing protein n=1 Tax=Oryza nivara TaxID=4536 RepID=A0A0E0J2G0_ORYNI
MVKCRIATCPILEGQKYFVGEAKSGGEMERLPGVKATVFCFEGDTAKTAHDHLNCLSHPYVIRSLGYGRGLGKHSRYTFLAVPFFDTTLAEYLPKERSLCIHMDRLTVEFIDIVGQIVRAMIALHNAGFCCSNLKGENIAVMKQHNSMCAKIWNFEKCKSDDDKDQDWKNLGTLLKLTGLWTPEARDLYTSLSSGNLKGMDILDHSALLTLIKRITPHDRLQGEKEVDLEWYMRKAWAEAFLKLQNFVRESKLTY